MDNSMIRYLYADLEVILWNNKWININICTHTKINNNKKHCKKYKFDLFLSSHWNFSNCFRTAVFILSFRFAKNMRLKIRRKWLIWALLNFFSNNYFYPNKLDHQCWNKSATYCTCENSSNACVVFGCAIIGEKQFLGPLISWLMLNKLGRLYRSLWANNHIKFVKISIKMSQFLSQNRMPNDSQKKSVLIRW